MAKQISRFESLGDRMKMYERIETTRHLMPGLPVMVRLDGKSFHSFTRGMERPFYEPMSRAMIETAKHLVGETKASFAYTQSDEITLGFWDPDPKSQMMFGGKIQKLCSVLASMATAKFNSEVAVRMPVYSHKLPVFDARVFNLPSLTEMANCVLFRALDCSKNSITMAASAYYSHKSLQGVHSGDKHEMLRVKGINWANYPAFFKDGTFVRRETVSRMLTENELSNIPEKHRPTGPVIRSVITEVVCSPFNKVENKVEFLFQGAAPIQYADK